MNESMGIRTAIEEDDFIIEGRRYFKKPDRGFALCDEALTYARSKR